MSGATDTAVLNFGWCQKWVFKPKELVLHLLNILTVTGSIIHKLMVRKCPDLLIVQNVGNNFWAAHWARFLILENYIITELQMNSLWQPILVPNPLISLNDFTTEEFRGLPAVAVSASQHMLFKGTCGVFSRIWTSQRHVDCSTMSVLFVHCGW